MMAARYTASPRNNTSSHNTRPRDTVAGEEGQRRAMDPHWGMFLLQVTRTLDQKLPQVGPIELPTSSTSFRNPPGSTPTGRAHVPRTTIELPRGGGGRGGTRASTAFIASSQDIGSENALVQQYQQYHLKNLEDHRTDKHQTVFQEFALF